MLKIYLDNCCYHRPFDDLSEDKIEKEATAKLFIQSLVKYRSISLCYSFISLSEIEASPFEVSKAHIIGFIEKNATTLISYKHLDELKALTAEIIQKGIKQKDATHLACAIFAKCDYFITTDKRLLNFYTDKIKIMNPIDFVNFWRDTV